MKNIRIIGGITLISLLTVAIVLYFVLGNSKNKDDSSGQVSVTSTESKELTPTPESTYEPVYGFEVSEIDAIKEQHGNPSELFYHLRSAGDSLSYSGEIERAYIYYDEALRVEGVERYLVDGLAFSVYRAAKEAGENTEVLRKYASFIGGLDAAEDMLQKEITADEPDVE